MLLKKKKQKVWCLEQPEPFEYIHFLFGERKKQNITTKGGKKYKIPSKIRCPHCKKKFKPKVKECGDINCWHIYVPAHKKYIKV